MSWAEDIADMEAMWKRRAAEWKRVLAKFGGSFGNAILGIEDPYQKHIAEMWKDGAKELEKDVERQLGIKVVPMPDWDFDESGVRRSAAPTYDEVNAVNEGIGLDMIKLEVYLKSRSVDIDNLCPEIATRMYQIASIFYREAAFKQMDNFKHTITSANDGKHMDGSLHYVNKAVDFRVRETGSNPKHFGRDSIDIICRKIRQLDRHFDVVDEGDHIHLEYDPK